MFAPYACDFNYLLNTTFGVSITPGANDAKGSYTNLFGATLAEDCYYINIYLTSTAVAGQARPVLLDIGADPAGGTTYGVLIPNLNGASATMFSTGGTLSGYNYQFPLFIKAGTRLAARAQVGNATAGTIDVVCQVLGKPKRPEFHRVGSYVDAVGIDTVNSRGTVITPGVSVVYGSYVSLGTLPRPAWQIQSSYSIDDDTMTLQAFSCEFAHGDATNKHLLQRLIGTSNASEMMGTLPAPIVGLNKELPSGSEIFARSLVSGATADGNNSAMVYALGG